MQLAHVARAMRAVTMREIFKFVQQRGRLLSALVRPLMWLAVFAAGFYNVFGVSIIPPYKTYITYQVYIVPGLLGIILLFTACSPRSPWSTIARWGHAAPAHGAAAALGAARLQALRRDGALGTCYVFLLVCIPFDVTFEPSGWLYVLRGAGHLGADARLAVAVSLRLHQTGREFRRRHELRDVPDVLLSSALYPLWKLREGSSEAIYYVSLVNPFTHCVELIRFALYGMFEPVAALVVAGATVVFFLLATIGYDPQRGMIRRAAQPA